MAGPRAQGIAIITGAAGGMGAPCASQMAEAGWDDLLLIDVNPERLEAVAAPLRAAGATVATLAADMTAPDFADHFLAALAGKPIGAVIHTAGVSPTMCGARRILEINLDATVTLVDLIRSRMAPQSCAVLFSSNSASMPMPPEGAAAFNAPLPAKPSVDLLALTGDNPQLAYPLSKIAVRAISRREAHAFGQRGARICTVSPGLIDTPLMGRIEAQASQMASAMAANAPFGRTGYPEELAAVCVFLCSPAASFVTAVDWLVDGGQTATILANFPGA
ncbi:MAG: SDR family oxidoreductase [Sphingomonadales bacterium]|nr:SDR family oxidoreductase [Sphingomonadales bacterium]